MKSHRLFNSLHSKVFPDESTYILSAKYRFTENPQNEYEVKFVYATCPIVENSQLPKDGQCEKYKYLRCILSNCDLLKDFPTLWDTRKNL